MPTSISDPRTDFIKLIDLDQSRVQLEPRIMFICGGQLNKDTSQNHSIRNMFINLSTDAGKKSEGFVLAENFKDWKDGYQSLSDFENDIAHLSSLLVIILESEGALTEFGLFFANKKLREKLVVIIHKEFHKSESFIKFGLLNPLEENNQSSVLVYEIDHRDIENVNISEVEEILEDILIHCDGEQKTVKFDHSNRGHQIFLIFQTIDLFLALTKTEIGTYLKNLGIKLSNRDISSALFILEKFNLLSTQKNSSQYFYFVPSELTNRIDFKFFKRDRRYDTMSIRVDVEEYYNKASKLDPSHRRRLKVIQAISAE